MAELAGLDTIIKISGAATTMTTEATSTSDDQNYQITNAVKRVLDRDTAPTVLDDGIETIESYTVNYLNGTITFDEADELRGPITITGKYLPMTTAAYAHSMSKTAAADMYDVTPFQSSHKKRLAGLLSESGTFSQFNIIDTTYAVALASGDPIVIEDRDTSTSEPNRTWALLNSVQVSAAIGGVQDMIVSWISHDAWIKLGG